MSPTARAAALVMAVLVAGSATARAQDALEPATPEPSAQDRELAAVLLDRSAVAYRLGRYEEAIVMLEDAYVLSREPILLYNLGRAYQGAGDAEHAIEAYRHFVEAAPEAETAEATRATIAELEQQLEAERRAAEEAAERARVEAIRRDAERAIAEREARAEEARARRAREERARAEREMRRTAAWATAGGGAGIVAVGAVLGGAALDRAGAASRAGTQEDASRLHGEASDLAAGANALFVIGGLAAAGGVAWLVVEMTIGDEHEATIEAAPAPGGLALRGTF